MELILPSTSEFTALQREFEEAGRCSIQPILAQKDAETLAAYLEQHEGWSRIRGLHELRFDIPAGAEAEFDEATAAQHREIDRQVREDSSKRFAFLYDAISMTQEALASDPDGPLAQLRHAMTSPEFMEGIRTLTGESEISGVEIQATRFRTGDFLSLHHDGPNVDRRIAIVFGFSRDWAPDWGGNLLFPGDRDRLEGVSPGFNRLDLFAVPQFHCVTPVAPSAPRYRHAVSGWYIA